MERIKNAEWKEEPGSEAILIRTSTLVPTAPPFAPLSVCCVGIPRPGARWGKIPHWISALHTLDTKMQHLEESPATYSLQKDELFLEPNRVIFINIQLQSEGVRERNST